MNEDQFETELIQYITSGTITRPEHLEGISDFIVREKPDGYCIKTKLCIFPITSNIINKIS